MGPRGTYRHCPGEPRHAPVDNMEQDPPPHCELLRQGDAHMDEPTSVWLTQQ